MGQDKKLMRKEFRDACFKRDQYRCAMCGLQSSPEKAEMELDAHHITNRKDLPNGGYVVENGISLCKLNKINCHWKAEQCLQNGSFPDYSANELYIIINSSYERAFAASKLKV